MGLSNGNGTSLRGLTQDVSRYGGDVGNPGTRQVPTAPAPDAENPSIADHGAAGSPQVSVIGVISAGDLAVHRDKVKQALQRGLEQNPYAVWVCIEKKSDRMTHDVMVSLGIDPVVLPLNDWWRVRGTAPDGTEVSYDGRRTWRDLEMLSLCDELIVFHKAASKTHWRDRAAKGASNLHVIDIGKPKKEQK